MCKNVAVGIMTKIYAFKLTFLQNGKQWLQIIQDKSKLKITLKCHFFKTSFINMSTAVSGKNII